MVNCNFFWILQLLSFCLKKYLLCVRLWPTGKGKGGGGTNISEATRSKFDTQKCISFEVVGSDKCPDKPSQWV